MSTRIHRTKCQKAFRLHLDEASAVCMRNGSSFLAVGDQDFVVTTADLKGDRCINEHSRWVADILDGKEPDSKGQPPSGRGSRQTARAASSSSRRTHGPSSCSPRVLTNAYATSRLTQRRDIRRKPDLRRSSYWTMGACSLSSRKSPRSSSSLALPLTQALWPLSASV